ncbi:MAG: F0F1 ATP synthase subunit gamma [Alphaproteobacteria bacterium]
MARLADIHASIGNMNELQGIVSAMRSLAGMRMQEAQRALPGVRRYAGSIVEGIASLMPRADGSGLPVGPQTGRRAVILLASEHGFAGGFNERLLETLQGQLKPDDELLVLGSRGVALVRERIRKPAWTYPMATRTGAVADLINRLSAELYRGIASRDIARVEVISARFTEGSNSLIECRAVLPLDPTSLEGAPRREPPLHNLTVSALQERLLAEYVSALLTEAVVESIASENAARFAAMESAHQNVSKKLDDLRQQARLMRQAEITSELLELATGAAALAGP